MRVECTVRQGEDDRIWFQFERVDILARQTLPLYLHSAPLGECALLSDVEKRLLRNMGLRDHY